MEKETQTPGPLKSELLSGQALRRQAEMRVLEKAPVEKNIDNMSQVEVEQMLHELRVHQVELEMQNEELRMAHKALDVSHARYLDLYDFAPLGYITLSEQGLILETNLTAASMLGVNKGVLVKRPVSRFILKEDQNIYYLHRKLLFEFGEPQECELRMVKNDGTTFWGHLTANLVQDDDGSPVYRVMLSDITEHKQVEEALQESEQKYRRMAENSPDMIYCMSLPDGEYQYVSSASISVFGYPPEVWYESQFFIREIIHPDCRSYLEEQWEKLLNGNVPPIYEYKIIHKDKSIRWINQRNMLVKDDNGSPVALESVVTDITERKLAEEQIKTFLNEKEILLKELYHRTKNNMQVINAIIDLQAQKISDEETVKIFNEIQNRIASMALVHQKLYQTKNLSRVDLTEYFKDLIKLLTNSLKEKAAKIQFNINALEPVDVPIDTAITCGLLMNELVSNTVKHAFPGNQKGDVQIDIKKIGGEEIELKFRDNGVGLPDGFDYRKADSMGLQTIVGLAEYQLKGSMNVISDKGLAFQIIFKDII